ncbi:MAG TPA: PIG-L family deacetylase [Thermoanaerobaculia bacterium]|nr:PIG-L family deacetylase [Thermoanaerobaculia bacterium]
MRLLWIGAHPDDEQFVAPWLGALSASGKAECGFLVATRGESGECLLPLPRGEDLGRVREREMRAAAALFGGEVWFANCRDAAALTPDAVLRAWTAEAGGMRALRRRFASIIEAYAPDRIVTFEWRHGCTWHADHRAIAILVQQLALPLPVTFAQSRVTLLDPIAVTAGSPSATAMDVRSTWDYLIRDLECHRTQFAPETVDLFRRASEDQRVVWLQHRGPWRPWHRPLQAALRMAVRAKERMHNAIRDPSPG